MITKGIIGWYLLNDFKTMNYFLSILVKVIIYSMREVIQNKILSLLVISITYYMINDCDRDYRLLPVEWLHNIWRPDSFFKNAKQVTLMVMNKDQSFSRSLSNGWLFQIITSGSTTARKSCTWSSESNLLIFHTTNLKGDITSF